MGKLLELLGSPIKDVIGAVGGIIDNLHTSGEEKLEAARKLVEIERQFQMAVMDADVKIAQAQAEVIKAEATSEGILARNWRPTLMLTFTFIIAWNFVIAPLFSVTTLPIPEPMWELLKLGIGGYVMGRSAEKIVPAVVEAVKKK